MSQDDHKKELTIFYVNLLIFRVIHRVLITTAAKVISLKIPEGGCHHPSRPVVTC